MFKKIAYIFSPKDKVKLVFLTIIIIVGSFLELLSVSIFSPFIELMMDNNRLYENRLLTWFYKALNLKNIQTFMALLALAIMIAYVVKNVYIIVEKNIIYRFSYRIQRNLSTNLLKAYMEEPYTFHLNKNISEIQRSMQEDTLQFANGLLHLMELIAEFLVCIALGIYLFMVSHSITVIIGGLMVVCLGVFTFINRKYSRAWGVQGQESKAKIYQWMNQAIGGIKEVKILNREDSFLEVYDEQYGKYVRVLRLNRLIGAIPKYIIEMVCMVGMLCAIIFKMYFGQREMQDFLPQLATFAVAAFRLLPASGRINEHMSAAIYAAPSLDLIYKDLREIEDLEYVNQPKDEFWKLQKEIEIKSVSYRYPNTDTDVIKEATLTVKKGQTVAFIGASGAGKSTLIDVLLGLLPPQRGHILADGMDVYKNLPTWQKEIGYIPQTIYLSDDSIRNNVAFGVREKDIDEEAVVRALKQAQLMDFIETLPDGLDSLVGDRGVRLSGGQRQRIGIARALYHNPEILVLDEATSALDNETESAVMEAVDSLHGSKTILIIAHRLTTIQNADQIYEIADGKAICRNKEEVLG